MLKFNDYLKEAALSAKQKKIAAVAGDKDKIDAHDLAALRAGKKPVDEASCSGNMKKEELVGNQHKLDKNKNGKLDAHDFKLLRKEEAEELDEGKMKELAMDLKDMSHDEFHKQYGKPKSHYDSTNFKKPVEPGKEMERAKALAQRGMQSLSKEEVERIEEKLTQIDELSKGTLGSYVKRSANQAIIKSLANPKDDSDDMKTIAKREKGINLATSKLAKEEVEQIDELSKKTLGSYVKKASGDLASSIHYERDAEENDDPEAAGVYAQRAGNRISGLQRAGKKIAKEEVEQEMSPYLKGTLKVMDEGKIDNLRDAQKLRRDTQSAYEKDYKPDTSHPHIQVVKGTAYGGANQKDDEGDEKPDETKEKKGRGRPAGSKSGARQKGGGHEDGGIPVHNLNLPKSYK
jgi:hypothetical protein